MLYTYNGILFNHEKERNSAIAIIWVDFKNIMLSEMSEKQKITYDIIYLYNLKWGIRKKQGNIGQRAQTSNFKTNEFKYAAW